MNITWLGQGGFILELGEKRICIDPYLSNSVAEDGKFERLVPIPVPPEELDVDLIIATHDHKDHLDEETIKDTDFEQILYAGPEPCYHHFKKLGIQEDSLVLLGIGDRYQLDNITFYGVYADHSPGSIGLVIEFNGLTLYLVGDSRYNQRLLEVKSFNPDIMVICINGKMGNMDYLEAATLAKKLEPAYAIPCHYGMFAENTEDPSKFRKELTGSGINYLDPVFNNSIHVEL